MTEEAAPASSAHPEDEMTEGSVKDEEQEMKEEQEDAEEEDEYAEVKEECLDEVKEEAMPPGPGTNLFCFRMM